MYVYYFIDLNLQTENADGFKPATKTADSKKGAVPQTTHFEFGGPIGKSNDTIQFTLKKKVWLLDMP